MIARTSFVAQTAALSKRAILALARQPSLVVPSLLFPLFFLALGTSSFSRTTRLPGFPEVDSFLDFALAGSIVQGVLIGSITGATALATEIEIGFFDRLLMTPTNRASILFGRLAGGMVYGATQTVVFAIVLLPFGLSIRSGAVGFVVIVLGGTLLALAVGAAMSSLALRTGSAEAVQGAFPLLFIALFFSSAFFPRQTMSGVYRRVADLNPVSHLVEGFRSLVVDGLTVSGVARTLLIPAGFALAGMTLALSSLRKRIEAS